MLEHIFQICLTSKPPKSRSIFPPVRLFKSFNNHFIKLKELIRSKLKIPSSNDEATNKPKSEEDIFQTVLR